MVFVVPACDGSLHTDMSTRAHAHTRTHQRLIPPRAYTHKSSTTEAASCIHKRTCINTHARACPHARARLHAHAAAPLAARRGVLRRARTHSVCVKAERRSEEDEREEDHPWDGQAAKVVTGPEVGLCRPRRGGEEEGRRVAAHSQVLLQGALARRRSGPRTWISAALAGKRRGWAAQR